jgi:hypothetical protein
MSAPHTNEKSIEIKRKPTALTPKGRGKMKINFDNMAEREGTLMNKFIIILMSLILALWTVSPFAPAQAQDAAKDDQPTFYRLTPGIYVNPWPRFTVTYPKDWVEYPPLPGEAFRAGPGKPGKFYTGLYVSPLLREAFNTLGIGLLNYAKQFDRDATIVSQKTSQLRDGTPAREAEVRWSYDDGIVDDSFMLAVKIGNFYLSLGVVSQGEKLGEDLKSIPYSLQYQPGKDVPVEVPPDVQEFLDQWCSDMVSHDVENVMSHYSDKFLNSGETKIAFEKFLLSYIDTIISFKVAITDFVPAGDRAYLAGYTSQNSALYMLRVTSIIKENGVWKWYGNQRNPISGY